jgi:hypothetical protein
MPKRFFWTKELVIKEAKKYNTRISFMNNSPSACKFAKDSEFFEDACSHMKPDRIFRINWPYDSYLKEAKKYNNRKDFRKGLPGVYSSANRKGILKEICAHMVRGYHGFNPEKPGIVYYIRVSSRVYGDLWKIGITNHSIEDRFLPSDLSMITPIKIWYFSEGRKAREMEKDVLDRFKSFRYNGETVLEGSGNTELFTKDVLGLDVGFNEGDTNEYVFSSKGNPQDCRGQILLEL